MASGGKIWIDITGILRKSRVPVIFPYMRKNSKKYAIIFPTGVTFADQTVLISLKAFY